jgi:toxin ParE1/3/4
MEWKILVKPSAEKEIRAAREWYEREQSNLGDHFIKSLDQLFEKILKNPKVFVLRYRNVRMGLTKRFPYAVHYIIEGNQITVLAILHTKRKPIK